MKLTNNCYAITGLGYIPPWSVNSGFVTGQSKTIIIDSGANYSSAQTIYGYAKNVRPGNELIIINTEKHLDHIGGNCFFKEKDILIYGHQQINRSDNDLKEDKIIFNKSISDEKRRNSNEEEIFFANTRIVNPGMLAADNQVFHLGGNVDVSVIYTPGHTSSNISLFNPGEKVLYCGDCIVNGYMPNIESAEKDDLINWQNSLDIISQLDIDHIVPGHGNVISGSDIKVEIDRMKKIIRIKMTGNP